MNNSFENGYEKWKKEREKANTEGYAVWKLQTTEGGVEALSKEIENRVNTWLQNNNNFISNAQYRAQNRGNAYVKDSKEWLATVFNQKRNFDSEAENIKSLLNEYKAVFNPEWVNTVNSLLDANSKEQYKVLATSADDSYFWSQFENEEDYNRIVRMNEYRDKYSGKSYEDILTMANALGDGEEKEWLNNNKYWLLPSASDFADKSQYKSTYRGGEEMNLWTGMYSDTGYDDIMYDYINRDEKAVKRQQLSDIQTDRAFLGIDESERKEMTDEEISIFNYLYATQGSEAAYEFIEYITSDLNARQRATEEAKWAEYAKESPFASSVFSVVTAPLKGLSYLGQFVDYVGDGTLEQNAGYNKFSYTSSAIRNEVGKQVEEKWGGVGSFAYQTGMSLADFLGTTAITGGGALTLAVMGSGAAADMTLSAKDRGLSDGQAFSLGTIAGVAEAAMEKLGLDALFNTKMLNKSVVKYMLSNALAEGGEEFGTDVINTIADIFIAQDQNLWQTAINNYMAQGKSESEAFALALADKAEELGLSFLGGAISGGVIGGGGVGVNTIGNTIEGSQQKKQYGSDIGAFLADEAVAINPEDSFAKKMKAKATSGKELSSRQVGKLLQQNETGMRENDMETIKSAAQNRLNALGETVDVETLALALAKQASGAELSRKEKNAIKNSKYGQRVANELNPDNINSGEYSSAWAEGIGTDRINANEYNRQDVHDSLMPIATQTAQNNAEGTEETEAEQMPTEKENSAQSQYEVSADGKTINSKSGEVVNIKNIESISENGEANLTLDDGMVVKASDLSYGTDAEGIIIGNIGKIKIGKNPISTTSANALYMTAMSALERNPNMTADEAMSLIKGLEESYVYGTYNLDRSKLTARNEDGTARLFAGELSQDQRKYAYELGAQDAVSKAEADQKVIDDLKAKANKDTSSQNTAKKGRVRFEDGVVAKGKLQKRTVSLAKHLARAIGVDIVFYDARTTNNFNGKDANGYFDEDTDTIYLDLQNSHNDAKTIAFTLSHELVHFIKKWSPAKFNTFAKFLMENYAKHGVDASALLSSKMTELGTTDADFAYEEMICDACETMLLDSNAVYKLMELRKTDLELFDKIKLHIHKLLNKIRDMYKELGLQPTSDEAKALLGMKDVLEQMYALFEEASVDAVQNYQAVQNANEAIFGEASVDVGKTESGIKNQLKNHKKIGEDATAYNDRHKKVHKAILQVGIESMYEMAETMLPYLEEEGILPPDIPGKTIFKNGSYGRTGENTTLCVRTLTYEDFKDRVAEVVGRPLTVSESLLVSQKIYDIATEPQCIYCYVAADRKAYDGYLGEYWKAMDKYIKALRKGGDSQALYTEYLAGRKDTNQQRKRWSQWEAIAKSGKEYISAKDLTTKRKRDVLIAKKNAFSEQIKDAQRYAQSASWAKTVFDYRAYKGDILKMTSTFVDMLNSEYGLRMYSFSDYTPAFIVENMQMLIDASVKGLKSLAYTKDTDYAEIFASTGQAINVSCFAKWDSVLGTYVEDNRQGANWEKTKSLRKQYRNVGAVMVATNDAMVEWALKQDWIDVVIPYHIVKTGTTIANEYQWNNYTSESADRVGNKTANIYPTEHNNDFATYSNLLNERGITPRFSKWYDKVASGELTEAQYMKLVNEVRLPASELSAVVPSFNLDAAKKSFGIDKEGKVIKGGFVDKGGYMGGWYRQGVDVNQEVMAVSEDIKAGKSSLDVDYGMSKAAKEKAEQRYSKTDGIKKQVKRIVGQSGTDYGIGVYLDTTKLSTLTEEKRENEVKKYIKSLGGKVFTAYDNDGTAVDIRIEKSHKKFTNARGKRVLVYQHLTNYLKNPVKQEAVILVDELILTAKQESTEPARHPHDWLDNNGQNDWDVWTTYIQDKENTVWKAKLQIANSIYGDKILYEIYPIEKVEGVEKIDANTSTDDKISQNKPIVKKQLKKSSYAPTFYSQMGKVVEGVKQEKLAANSVLYEGQVMYQKKTSSNRNILANALEGAAQSDIERNKLAQYKEKIALIETEEQRLSEIQKQLFTKGAVEPTERKALQFEAKQISNRINTYDRQLLNLESTTALKNVLNREKALAMKRQKQKDAEYLAQYKEKVAKTQKELLERNQESRKKAIEGREKTAMRHKIKGVVNDLNNLLLKPSKERHVPEEMRIAVAEALDIVNMDTVDADTRVAHYNDLIAKATEPDVIASLTETRDRILNQGNKLAEKLTKLKDAYSMVRDSADDSLRSMYDDVIYSRIESVQKIVGNTPLRNMTLGQLESVYDLYKMVLTTIRDSNKAFAENITQTRMALGSNTFAEIKKGNKARGTIKHPHLEKFLWQNLKPMQAMKTIGSSTLQKLWNNILYGQETFAQDYDEAVKFAKEMKDKHGYEKWNKDKLYSFDSKSGKTMKLTLEQMMSIYAYSKRAQADEHIEYGGIVLNEGVIKVKNKLGKTVEVKVNDSTAYRLDKTQVASIVATLEKVAPGAKAFVDEMQKYLSETMGEKGNEVAMKMYGIKLFKEEHYFPLKSSKAFMEAANAKLKGDVKIKNKGMTKSTVEHARNPIVLENFLDVWGNHVNEMAMYHGLVLPLEDFSRTLNYGFKADDDFNTDAESVRTALHDAFGDNADDYLNELLKAINGGVLHDSSAQFADRMISKFKKSKVMASLSVIVQQPTAIIRAMSIIEPKYFVAQNFNHKATWEELKKYCPTAIIKETGSFDTNMGRTIVDMIKDDRGFTDKVGDVLGKAPAYMDEMGWNMIWRALKKKVATEQKRSGEALLQECGKQMTLIINETQVYDSVMSRNELMRSKSAFTKMATAFMAEPTTVANMIYGAALDFNRGKKGLAGKAVAATIASVIINSLVSAIVYAMRDDDEEKTFLEKYISSATTEVIDGLNPLTYIPFVKDAYSLFQGYDVERTDMALIGDVVDVINDFYNVLDPEKYEGMSEEEITKHIYENSVPLLTAICDMFGLPVGNVLRDAEAIIVQDNAPMSQTSPTGTLNAFKEGILSSLPQIVSKVIGTESKQDKLYDAIVSGDTAYIERLKSGYKDEASYETAVRKALRENDERIKEAAEAYNDGDIRERDSILDEIVAEGFFDEDLVFGAITAEANALKSDTEEESEVEEEKATSIYKADDVNVALESGDKELALEIIDDLVKTKVENGMEEDKAKSSVKSSVTFYWKPLYKAAYKNKDSEEMTRIRKLLFDSGLYGRASQVSETCRDWIKELAKEKK